MSYLFSANEIFEMAIEIERNGAAFYRKAAQQFSKSLQRDTLLGFADMEDDHRRTFERMRSELPKEDTDWADPDEEAVRYLQMFASGQVFDITADPSESVGEGTTLGEILIKAIEIERESILFYTGMKVMVPHSLGRDNVDDIIREEVGHVTVLHDQLELLGGA